jgi:mannose-1-phosphate guanylyltransferase
VIDANALVYDSTNCIIKGSKDKLIVVQGLHEYLIGEFGNVVIVCDKNREDQFRRFVNDVKARPGGGEFL